MHANARANFGRRDFAPPTFTTDSSANLHNTKDRVNLLSRRLAVLALVDRRVNVLRLVLRRPESAHRILLNGFGLMRGHVALILQDEHPSVGQVSDEVGIEPLALLPCRQMHREPPRKQTSPLASSFQTSTSIQHFTQITTVLNVHVIRNWVKTTIRKAHVFFRW